jgi:hypothetical protein|tara:strand:- start:121 stop:303 length:183 start_codon:yes stop_codon:yes gene_type:complete
MMNFIFGLMIGFTWWVFYWFVTDLGAVAPAIALLLLLVGAILGAVAVLVYENWWQERWAK